MIRRLLISIGFVIASLPLTSAAALPASSSLPLAVVAVAPAPLSISRIVLAKQECNEAYVLSRTGLPYLRQQVVDSRGIPFGEVAAWDCGGNSAAAVAEFQRRLGEMQARAP